MTGMDSAHGHQTEHCTGQTITGSTLDKIRFTVYTTTQLRTKKNRISITINEKQHKLVQAAARQTSILNKKNSTVRFVEINRQHTTRLSDATYNHHATRLIHRTTQHFKQPVETGVKILKMRLQKLQVITENIKQRQSQQLTHNSFTFLCSTLN